TIGTQALVTAGREQETSVEYVNRALASWSRLGAAWTLDSFDYLIPLASLTVTGWRVDDANPFGPGTIAVYLRNAAGAATPQEISDVDAVLNSRAVRALGSGALTVASAATQAVGVTATLTT